MPFDALAFIFGATTAGLGIVGATAYRSIRAIRRRRMLRRRLTGKRPSPVDTCMVAGMGVVTASHETKGGYRDASWTVTVRPPASDVMTVTNHGRRALRRSAVWKDLPPRLALEVG